MLQQTRGNEYILIVCSDPTVLKILQLGFRENNFELVQVATARDACEQVATNDFSYVIADVQLPDMNGFQLAEKLKQLSATINVLMLTDYPDLEKTVKALEGPVDDYLLKPFRFEQVLSVLMRFRRLNYYQKTLYERERQIAELERENQTLRDKIRELLPGDKVYAGIREKSQERVRKIQALSSYSQHIKEGKLKTL